MDLGARSGRMDRIIKRLVPFAISLVILAAIYWKLDLRELARGFARSDPTQTALSLSMVIPITMLTAWRLQLLSPAHVKIGFAEANGLILVASALNVVLPSKMGEIAKAYFMTKRSAMSGALSLSIVIVEKMSDTLSLLLWCAFGLTLYPQKDALFWALTALVILGLIAGVVLLRSRSVAHFFFASAGRIIPASKIDPPKSSNRTDSSRGEDGFAVANKVHRLEAGWIEMQDFFWADKLRLIGVSALSVFIWFLHLLQIWLFILALRSFAPFVAALGLAPLAIFAGLLPLTFAGIGTRDAALIFLFHRYLDAPAAAAVGLLCTARYLIPAIAGLPVLHKYLGKFHPFPKSSFRAEQT